jgi:hypothetical protein
MLQKVIVKFHRKHFGKDFRLKLCKILQSRNFFLRQPSSCLDTFKKIDPLFQIIIYFFFTKEEFEMVINSIQDPDPDFWDWIWMLKNWHISNFLVPNLQVHRVLY